MPVVVSDWLQYGGLGIGVIVLIMAATMVRWVMNASTVREAASTDREKYFFSQMEQQRTQFTEALERQREEYAALIREEHGKFDEQLNNAYSKFDALSSSFGRVAASLIDVADRLSAIESNIDVVKAIQKDGSNTKPNLI
jgi:hypothetical protein